MVPVYTISCVCSIKFYHKHVYIAAGYEFYESIVISSFFMLMCRYIRQDLDSIRRVFSHLIPCQWIPPIRFVRFLAKCGRTRLSTDGVRWFNVRLDFTPSFPIIG